MDDFKEVIERIKEKNDIVEVVGEHIHLDRGLRAICPFHEEKKASFHVHRAGQYFDCFGCGAGGDVIRFIELYRKMSFVEALARLGERAGITFDSISNEDERRMERAQLGEDILEETVRFYHQSLKAEVKAYLAKERKIQEETIEKYMIGYARGG